MKVFVSILLMAVITSSFAQTASYDFYNVTPVVGNGIRLWGSDLYKIHFGNTSEYLFGPVTDYSIKMNMSSQAGRGWTWGVGGATPVAALSNQGNMQIAGTFTAGWIGIGTLTPSYDIDISRNGSGAGIRIFSPSLTGRSTVIIGQANGGKYGYLAHQSQSYDAGTGYTLTYKPSSTVLVGSDVNGLGIISTSDIRFSTGGDDDTKQKAVINSAGNVGIGMPTPLQKLHINGNLRVDGPSGYNHSELEFYRGDGLKFASIGQGDLASANSTFDIQHFNGNDIRFLNANVEQVRILASNGNVGIGTPSPDAKLAVSGQVHAQEVKVSITVPGPDYVFEKNYKLPTLEEIKTYIDQNKHLPEVPSAVEMEKNGMLLGEMNMLLLKKVEELTLYAIEMNKNVKELKKMNEDQQKELEELRNKIK